MSLNRNKVSIVIVILIISFFIPTSYSYAAIFNVTWAGELWEALSIAANNSEDDTINLAAGSTYNPDGNSLGFPYLPAPTENFSLEIHGVGAGLVVLNSGIGDPLLIVDLTNLEDVSNTVIEISDLTISKGWSRSDGDAGGLTIRANIVEGPDNLDDMPIVRVERVEFLNNISRWDGGGANISGGVVTISECIFVNNSADNSGGGAIVNGNELTFSNNIFIENVSDSQGGGLVAFSTDKIVLSNNIFKDNNSHMGGGARITAEFADISGNEFTGNSALSQGGGAIVNVHDLNMSDNEFTGNSTLSESDLGGGGVGITNTNQTSTTTLTNNIFSSNNSAGNGGGLSFKSRNGFSDNVITLTNNTFALNTANLNGGGISINAVQPPEVLPPDLSVPPSVIIMLLDIYNNIVFDNSAGGNGGDIFIFEKGYNVSDLTFNLFNSDFSDVFSNQLIAVGNNIDEDPQFVDAEAGDFSLQPDSPAIDAGDPNAPDLPSTDFFGNPRIPPPDMGAVEYIEEAVKGGGGCTLTHTPVTSSLAVFLAIPVLILIRRVARNVEVKGFREV